MRWLSVVVVVFVLVAVYRWGHDVGYTTGVDRCWDDQEAVQR